MAQKVYFTQQTLIFFEELSLPIFFWFPSSNYVLSLWSTYSQKLAICGIQNCAHTHTYVPGTHIGGHHFKPRSHGSLEFGGSNFAFVIPSKKLFRLYFIFLHYDRRNGKLFSWIFHPISTSPIFLASIWSHFISPRNWISSSAPETSKKLQIFFREKESDCGRQHNTFKWFQ